MRESGQVSFAGREDQVVPDSPPRHYVLKCELCGATFEDDGVQLRCSGAHTNTLLITNYVKQKLRPDDNEPGIYRYREWLPIRRTLFGSGRTVTYRSDRLSRAAGLPNLWVAFNGLWPEKDALMPTGTFKDLEAYTVLARIPQQLADVLVVTSAGNTAMAFAYACSLNAARCLIIVPEQALKRMCLTKAHEVKIVSLSGGSDYSDAISLGELLGNCPGFVKEGGVQNVGRRDGLGTVLLNAVEAIGMMPDYYFQAIGSGAGAIAVHEAAKRLLESKSFGSRVPRQMLSQNLPFAPIYKSWIRGVRDWVPLDSNNAKREIGQIDAAVLSNRNPPYAIGGGVFDTLTESGGTMLAARNEDIRAASLLFEELEGIQIEAASAVAFATLLRSAHVGQIERDAVVLLNVTGGGRERANIAGRTCEVRPDLELRSDEIGNVKSLERIAALFI
jgi:cysteate synthase